MSPAFSLDELQNVPRPVRLRTITIIVRFIVWTLLLGVLFIGPFKGMAAINRLNWLQKSGLVINADLIDATVHDGKSTSYHFTVAFNRGSTPVEETRLVTQDLYFQYSNQHTLPVTVSPQDPNDFEIGTVTDDVIASTRSYCFWTVFVLFTFAAAFTVGLEASLFGERKLMISGQAVHHLNGSS